MCQQCELIPRFDLKMFMASVRCSQMSFCRELCHCGCTAACVNTRGWRGHQRLEQRAGMLPLPGVEKQTSMLDKRLTICGHVVPLKRLGGTLRLAHLLGEGGVVHLLCSSLSLRVITYLRHQVKSIIVSLWHGAYWGCGSSFVFQILCWLSDTIPTLGLPQQRLVLAFRRLC